MGFLERVASRAASWAGSSWAFALAAATILVWAITGPLFRFSDTWQLVINTGTTIVTFLMVFLLQRSQNKESQALQLKLNELVAAAQGASNRLINLEDYSEGDLRVLHTHYGKLAELAAREERLTESHSVEEAEGRHRAKVDRDRANEPDGAVRAPGDRDSHEPSCDDELAEFLRAADRLREKIQWPEDQGNSHLAEMTAAREALPRQRPLLEALLRLAEGQGEANHDLPDQRFTL